MRTRAVVAGLVHGPLQRAQQRQGTRDGQGHEAELAEELAPLLRACSSCSSEVLEDGLRGARQASSKKWRKFLGKLRFMALAIPGAVALLSALQWARNQAGDNRVRITLPV